MNGQGGLLQGSGFMPTVAGIPTTGKRSGTEFLEELPPGEYLVAQRNVESFKMMSKGRLCPLQRKSFPIFPGFVVGVNEHSTLISVARLYRLSATNYYAVTPSGSRYTILVK